MSEAAVVIDGLSKWYGRGAPALDGVTLSVAPGEFVAVLGPSGAGKTTLLRCLLRLTEPDTGSIHLGGREITGARGAALARARRETAVIFQQFNLVRRLTAVENVLAGRLAGAPLWRALLRRFPRADRQRALYALDRVGLLEQAYQRADTLSGGQQQRVAVARALAQEPQLILADEPVASLDPESAAAVLRTLRAACDDHGVTVVCNLHQTGYAREYASRVVGLTAGRIVADVPVTDLDERVLRGVYGSHPHPPAPASENLAPRPPSLRGKGEHGWDMVRFSCAVVPHGGMSDAPMKGDGEREPYTAGIGSRSEAPFPTRGEGAGGEG